VCVIQLILRVPIIVLKLEGGVGKRTVPLLIVESAFQAEVRDWTTKVTIATTDHQGNYIYKYDFCLNAGAFIYVCVLYSLPMVLFQLYMESSLKLEVAYYNEKLAVWERS
jgi:hypothetical protein